MQNKGKKGTKLRLGQRMMADVTAGGKLYLVKRNSSSEMKFF
jgi:DNA-binding IclR family transcriptional regulator